MNATSRGGWIAAALALAACGGSGATTRSGDAPASAAQPVEREPVEYALYALPVIGGTQSTPEAYTKGVEAFTLGEAAYEAKHYDEAAEEFLDAGLTFHVPMNTPYAREMLHMSELSCRNAALAWKTTHQIDKVSITRSDVQQDFPACASGLEQEGT
jgi:hypothetical protein